MADSGMYYLTLATSGKPIVLGERAGSNSVFRWNGKSLETETRVKTDAYSDTYPQKLTTCCNLAKSQFSGP